MEGLRLPTNWNLFQLRPLNPLVGRWYNPDPYGQFHSSYLAMGNNPISQIDPDGGYSMPSNTDIAIQGVIATHGYNANINYDAAIAAENTAVTQSNSDSEVPDAFQRAGEAIGENRIKAPYYNNSSKLAFEFGFDPIVENGMVNMNALEPRRVVKEVAILPKGDNHGRYSTKLVYETINILDLSNLQSVSSGLNFPMPATDDNLNRFVTSYFGAKVSELNAKQKIPIVFNQRNLGQKADGITTYRGNFLKPNEGQITISIDPRMFDNFVLLSETVAHEILHASHWVSGKRSNWYSKYGREVAHAISEVYAYQLSAKIYSTFNIRNDIKEIRMKGFNDQIEKYKRYVNERAPEFVFED